jgi:hypothetical protein
VADHSEYLYVQNYSRRNLLVATSVRIATMMMSRSAGLVGLARPGPARPVLSGPVWPNPTRPGPARPRHGPAWPGVARPGPARPDPLRRRASHARPGRVKQCARELPTVGPPLLLVITHRPRIIGREGRASLIGRDGCASLIGRDGCASSAEQATHRPHELWTAFALY